VSRKVDTASNGLELRTASSNTYTCKDNPHHQIILDAIDNNRKDTNVDMCVYSHLPRLRRDFFCHMPEH